MPCGHRHTDKIVLKFYRREKSQTLWNLSKHIGTLVLDEILFDTDLLGGFEDGRIVGLSRPQRHVVLDIGAAAEVPLDPLGEVFQVHRNPTVRIFPQQFDRVLTGKDRPENVHLVFDEVRVGFLHEKVEERESVFVWIKFVPVNMIIKLDARILEPLADSVKICGDFQCLGFIERCIMRNPSGSNEFDVEKLSVVDTFIRFVEQGIEVAEGGSGFDVESVESLTHLLSGHSILVAESDFDFFEALFLDVLPGFSFVLSELIAEGVKLQADRSAKGGFRLVGVNGWGKGKQNAQQGGGKKVSRKKVSHNRVFSWVKGINLSCSIVGDAVVNVNPCLRGGL